MLDLKKGNTINLKKSNGTELKELIIGVDWGMIEKKGFFGGNTKVAVDLDLSITLLDTNKNHLNTVFFGNLKANGIKHSGDDLVGDDGSDDSDNEVIKIKLDSIDSNTKYIVAHIVSYGGKVNLNELPYATARIYSANGGVADEKLAEFKMTELKEYSGKKGIILGYLTKENGSSWSFKATGTALTLDHPKNVSKEISTGNLNFL